MRIAINGAGIAGPTLAFWLQRAGFQTVLYEKSAEPRVGGYMIDFWGVGYDVAVRMGLIDQIKQASYLMEQLRIVDRHGRNVTSLPIAPIRRQLNGRFLSIPRGDLASILLRACPGVPVRFGVSVDTFEQDETGVTVRLSDGSTDRFDVVVGTDGLHSRIRALLFQDRHGVERPLGCHVAAFRLSGYQPRDDLTYVSRTVPKRQVARISLREGLTLILMICRSDLIGEEPVGPAAQRAALRRVFDGMGWEVPRILDAMDQIDELYFDRVSQIRLDRWSRGRVALVGDAAACVSFLAGEGTGLAMAEAYVLAHELAHAHHNPTLAFRAYESQLFQFLRHKQASATRMLGFFAPQTSSGLWLRDRLVTLAAVPWLARLIIGSSLTDDFSLPAQAAGGLIA